jgi:hypothetical protein
MKEINKIEEEMSGASTDVFDRRCIKASKMYFKIEEYRKAIQFAQAIKITRLKIEYSLELSRSFIYKKEFMLAREVANSILKYAENKKLSGKTMEVATNSATKILKGLEQASLS